MSRVTIPHGGVVKCDMPKCTSRFTTYSVASKAREQAANEGWARISGKGISIGNGLILSTKKVDLCPDCKPKPIMTGSAT